MSNHRGLRAFARDAGRGAETAEMANRNFIASSPACRYRLCSACAGIRALRLPSKRFAQRVEVRRVEASNVRLARIGGRNWWGENAGERGHRVMAGVPAFYAESLNRVPADELL